MDPKLALAAGLAAAGVTAGLLYVDVWARTERSLAQRLWSAYDRWYREQTDYLLDRTPLKRFVLQQILGSLVGTGVALSFTAEPLLLLLIIGIGAGAPVVLLKQRVAQRRQRLQQQIDQALMLIANAMQVTPNLEEALSLVAEHLQPPMSEEVARVVMSYRLGQPLDDALSAMSDRCNDSFLMAMVMALKIGRKTGGNIAATLRRIALSTRESVRVELELSSKTRGQRNQFLLIALLYPLGVLSLKSTLPQAWDTLTNTFLGKATLAASAAVVGVAVVWARAILNPKNL